MRAAEAVVVLLATAAPVSLALVLHALPTTDLTTAGLGWVVPALAGGLAVAASLATLASLVVALRDGSLAMLLLAGASAALVGGSLGLVGGASGMSLATAGTAVLVLGAAIGERTETLVHGRAARFGAAAAVLVAGGVAAAEVVPATATIIGPLAPAILLAAAAAAGVGAVASARL